MPRLLTQSRFQKTMKKIIKPQSGWLDVFFAVTGKLDGTVNTGTPGMMYVRDILTGQVLTVYNGISPLDANVHVEVGRRVDEPNLWQIKAIRQSFDVPATANRVKYHAEQHYLTGGDPVWFDRKQVLQLTTLVSDSTNFIVQVIGGVIQNATGMALVDNEEIDLSSYIPTAGAIYASIEADEDGALTVQVGEPFGTPAFAAVDTIHELAAGRTLICAVLLFESMEALLNEHILIPAPTSANPQDYAIKSHTHNYLDLMMARAAKSNALKIYPNTNFM